MTATVERMEFAVLTRDEKTGTVSHHLLTEEETTELLELVTSEIADEGDE